MPTPFHRLILSSTSAKETNAHLEDVTIEEIKKKKLKWPTKHAHNVPRTLWNLKLG